MDGLTKYTKNIDALYKKMIHFQEKLILKRVSTLLKYTWIDSPTSTSNILGGDRYESPIAYRGLGHDCSLEIAHLWVIFESYLLAAGVSVRIAEIVFVYFRSVQTVFSTKFLSFSLIVRNYTEIQTNSALVQTPERWCCTSDQVLLLCWRTPQSLEASCWLVGL